VTDNLPSALRALALIYAGLCFLGILMISVPNKEITYKEIPHEDPQVIANITEIPRETINERIGDSTFDPVSSSGMPSFLIHNNNNKT